MNRRVLLVGLLVSLPLIAVLAANLGRDPRRIDSPLVGRPAPAFVLRQAGTDRGLALESLGGGPAVINFWATWCPPCFEEHRLLTRVARELGPAVAFVGVVYDDEEETVLRFLAENGSAYPVLMDDGGRTAIAYGVYGVPESFFLDPRGRIVSKVEGPLTRELLAAHLQVAEGAGP